MSLSSRHIVLLSLLVLLSMMPGDICLAQCGEAEMESGWRYLKFGMDMGDAVQCISQKEKERGAMEVTGGTSSPLSGMDTDSFVFLQDVSQLTNLASFYDDKKRFQKLYELATDADSKLETRFNYYRYDFARKMKDENLTGSLECHFKDRKLFAIRYKPIARMTFDAFVTQMKDSYPNGIIKKLEVSGVRVQPFFFYKSNMITVFTEYDGQAIVVNVFDNKMLEEIIRLFFKTIKDDIANEAKVD